jgi:hypothetical protein
LKRNKINKSLGRLTKLKNFLILKIQINKMEDENKEPLQLAPQKYKGSLGTT